MELGILSAKAEAREMQNKGFKYLKSKAILCQLIHEVQGTQKRTPA